MKCPLLSKVYIEEPERSNTDIADCLKEKCAWWDDKSGQCCMLSLAGFLSTIGWNMGGIAKELTLVRPK